MATAKRTCSLPLTTCNVVRLLRENEFRFSKNCTKVARDLDVPLEERAHQLAAALHIDSDYSDYFEECIDYWLRNGQSPSWEKLLDIIARFDKKTASSLRSHLKLPQVIMHSTSIDSGECVTKDSKTTSSTLSPTTCDNSSQLIELLKSMTIEDPQQIEINCKVFNADTNQIIKTTSSPLTRDIKLVKRSKRVQEFDSSSVKIGTSIRIEISTDCNCYLYIVNIGTSGNTTVLLPNEFDHNNFFRSNQIYYLPDEEFGFEISGPAGKETIQVLAFTNKQPLFDKLSADAGTTDVYRDISIRRKTATSSAEKKGFAQVQFNVQS